MEKFVFMGLALQTINLMVKIVYQLSHSVLQILNGTEIHVKVRLEIVLPKHTFLIS